MMGILWGKFQLLKRKPGPLISTTIICMVLAFLTGISSFSKIEIPVYSTMSEKDVKNIIQELNKGGSFEFTIQEEKKVKDLVAEGKAEAGVELKEATFTIYQASDTQNFQLIKQHVSRYYQEMNQEMTILSLADNQEDAKKKLKEIKEDSAQLFNLSVSSYKDEGEWKYDQSLQSLFGFALFFSIYTVAFHVVEILKEKQNGLWDRLILSPTSKTQLYLANLIYSFVIGYIQIALIFIIFKYAAGVNFYGSFGKTLILIIPYLFAIVSLSILLTGLVKTMGQFNALVPLIGVSFAMLGGAYWPIEIVTSNILIGISKVIPITYGMELLKGATLSGMSYSDLMYPISTLILMGVVMMGVGIRLMERRHV